MQEDIYKVQIEDIFEGPMDLLVHLIKKHEVDIYDIPIALITKQYLEYLEWMKIMNIDIAGDFIVMASTLTKIKSRLLLPSHGEEDEEDPRLELVKPIEEYLKMKSAAEKLGARTLLGEDTFIRNPILAASGLFLMFNSSRFLYDFEYDNVWANSGDREQEPAYLR